MSPEILGLWLFFGLFVLILAGFPMAFTLVFVALVAGLVGVGSQAFDLMIVQFESTMESSTLAANMAPKLSSALRWRKAAPRPIAARSMKTNSRGMSTGPSVFRRLRT